MSRVSKRAKTTSSHRLSNRSVRSGYKVRQTSVIGFEHRDQCLWKEDGLAFAEIDGSVANISYDASKLDHLTVRTSTMANSVLLGLRGQLDLGASDKEAQFIDCIFSDCEIKKLSNGYAHLENCEFRRCDIRELWSFDASLKNCRFSGRIRKGAFNISPEFHKFSEDVRTFSGNDFSECVIDENIFRGGIDLSDQHFNRMDGSMVIRNVSEFLRVLRQKLDQRPPDLELERIANLLEFASQRFQQNDALLPGKRVSALGANKNFIMESLREIRGKAKKPRLRGSTH
jgi:hypothetical protein